MSGFKAIRVSPLNPRAMNDKTRPSSMYVTKEDNNHTYEDIGNSDDAGNDSQNGERMQLLVS